MSKSQKIFRYLWRVNAILILLATAAIAFGAAVVIVQETRTKAAEPQKETVALTQNEENPDLSLRLGRTWVISGTEVICAELVEDRGDGKFGSSGGTVTRNMLFIDPDQKSGRWLLPDNKQVISDATEVLVPPESDDSRTVATAVIVKPAKDSTPTGSGRLLLFDKTAKKIVEISKNVNQIHVASLSGRNIVLLFERKQHLVRATLARDTLEKLTETEIELP